MQTWQDMLIQALLGFVLFIIGLHIFKITIRKLVSQKFGDIVLQSVIFLALLIAFAFLQFPSLAKFSFIGAVLVVLVATAISRYLQETATEQSKFEQLFGERTGDILSDVTANVRVNEKALRRLSIMLRGRNAITTQRAKTTISLHNHSDNNVPYILYDVLEYYLYDDANKDIDVYLVWQIIPTWLRPTPYSMAYPLMPLEYGSPGDKWKVSYFPPIEVYHIDLWQKMQADISVQGDIANSTTRQSQRLEFQRQVINGQERIGDQSFSYSYPVFTARTRLGRHFPELRVKTMNIPHPISKPSFYFYAWDMCDRWEAEISCGDTDYKVLQVTPMTNHQVVALVDILNRGDYARVVLEARNGAIVMPEDAVTFSLTSRLHRPQ